MRILPILFAVLIGGVLSLNAQNAPVVVGTLGTVAVAKGGGSAAVALGGKFALDGVRGPIVRFSLVTGVVDVELFPEVAPATVANFRKYMTDLDYDGTFVHRAVPGFVIQGGGYKTATPYTHIPTDPVLKNEFQRSNVAGTIAMAKIEGDINSATSEWFFNLVDNTFLDPSGKQFAVFGKIIGKGMSEAQKIAALPVVKLDDWVLTNLPLFNYTSGDVYTSNLVALNSVREIPLIPATGTAGGYLTLTASSSNSALVMASVSGATLTLRSVGSATGSATITVRAADISGQSVQTTFRANVINPALPYVSITLPDGQASEAGANPGIVRIQRTGATTASLAVKLSFAGSTALSGVDFKTVPATVTIPSRAAFLDVTVSPVNDALKEGLEIAKLTLGASPTYNVSAQDSAQISIWDDDVPDVSLSVADGTAVEGTPANTARVRFSRTGATSAPLSIPFTVSGPATRGTDFTVGTSPAMIPAGAAFVDVVIAPLDDTIAEGWETVTLTAAPSTGANLRQPTATVGVQDNEVPTVTQTVLDGTAAEPGTDKGSIKFTRTGATTAPLTVYFQTGGTATSGTDYQALPKAATIPAGSAQAVVTITPKDDVVKENAETVTLTLSPTAFYNATPGTTTVTIGDND